MTVDFSPFLPWPIIAIFAVIMLGIAAYAIWRGMRGAWIRLIAAAALLVALANPLLLQEDRDQLSTIVPVIVDRSQSQQTPERIKMTEDALAQLKDRLAQWPRIEPRFVDATEPSESDTPSTRLFSAMASAIADVPPARIGGAIFLTDGQIHDIPGLNQALGFNAPIHGLITGKANEFDRRIEVVRGPRFGIVNEEQQLFLRVVDDGPSPGGMATVTVKLNGDEIATLQATPGQETPFSFKVPRAGNNVLEFSVAELPGEITTANDRAVHLIEGIRQNMRVLLVSGEPHAGERAWRNLLKSDASVDLVHFTILRPPEKQDGTPINELSLIAFPTRELFVDKINDFDLIIFDRYQHRGVLPILYYDYIAQYVQNGGALLIAAGPEHAGEDSIALTPLASVLPAAPTGQMIEKPFYPRLSEEGRKHPVTRGLDGSDQEPPHWGRWFRTVDVEQPQGQTVMVGADNHPLLVLNRAGQGRVAMLLSDQGWLWSRGFEGGGPSVSLYRRIAHWLMKEPALEEEALTATASGRTLQIARQTIGDDPGNAIVKYPSGKTVSVKLAQSEPGLFRADKKTDEIGLFEVSNGNLSTLVHVGAVDAPEFKAMISTTETLKPLADKTKGLVARVASSDGGATVPAILPVRGAVRVADNQRMTIRLTDETVLKGINTLPLFSGFVGLAALLLAFSATWWREGR
ncbi:glutamine amidotransferase [Rhizobium sp. 2YAF20]|uniref:glutamine amidotransferase n=1 Tax=Rhizobium sp. 2YAF20 TaxID=3233027 RepID=UPI003F9697B2